MELSSASEKGSKHAGGDPRSLENTVSVQNGDTLEVHQDLVAAQGHAPVLRKNFSTLASLGLGFSITNSWIGYVASFGTNIIYGGMQNVILGLLVATFVQFFITLGLSELASAFPSAGGQYHFVYLLTPDKWKRFSAFIVGWLSIIGWWVLTCSGISLATVSVSGMVGFWFPDYVAHPWCLYLIFLAVIASTAIPIYLAHDSGHLFTQFGLGASILGAAVTFIVVLAMKQETQPASVVFASNQGSSGWGQNFAWALGICNAMYAFVATDAAIHIAEEMLKPSSQIRFILNTTILIGFLTTFPLIMAMMFCLNDLDAVVSSSLPALEVYYQATGSKVAATVLQVILTVSFFSAIFAEWITCSRMVWAFARDGGLPFSDYFAHIDAKRKMPVRALIASTMFCALYGLLYFASSTAFNSIVTSAVIYLNLTYVVPQTILLFRGRHLLPTRVLSLGPLGWSCNAFSLVTVSALSILLCFPPILPAETASMNYTSVVMAGLAIIVLGLWFSTGKNFRGPDVDLTVVEDLASRGLDSSRRLLGVEWKYSKHE